MLKNLRKAVSFCAFAFVFIFVTLNLSFGGSTKIDVMPDFIGWLLFFLAFDYFGDYAKGNEYLKWAALVIMVLSIVQYAFILLKPELTHDILDMVISILQTIYIFMILGVIESVAQDIGSARTDRIHTIRIASLALDIALFIIGRFVTQADAVTSVIVLAGLLAACVIVILILVALFGLRKEISLLAEGES